MDIKNLINEKKLFLNEKGLNINYEINEETKTYLMLSIKEDQDNKNQIDFIRKEFKEEHFSLLDLYIRRKEKSFQEFTLTEPERFGQLALHNYVYYSWEMEKPKRDNIGKGDQYDLYLNYKEKIISLVEVKNFDFSKDNTMPIGSWRSQLHTYIINNINDIDEKGNFFSLLILDGNYLFNNPNIITYISDQLNGLYVPKRPFLKQENFFITKENLSEFVNASVMEKCVLDFEGVVSLLEVNEKEYVEIKDAKGDIKQISTSVMPSNLAKLESDTNVRDMKDSAVEVICKAIIEDITSLGIENYFARTSGTGDKHVSLRGIPLTYNIQNKKIIVGFNIDEFNGQHSTNAYKAIEEQEDKFIKEIKEQPTYSETFNKNINKFREEQLLIPIKIFPYKTTSELLKIKENSNFSVGKPELKKSKYIPLIKHINRKLFDLNSNIQIYHPKKRNINLVGSIVKYNDFFSYINRFIHAYKKENLSENIKTDGFKIRDRQVNSSLDNKIMDFFFNVEKDHENYRDHNRAKNCYEKAKLKKLIFEETLLIQAWEETIPEDYKNKIIEKDNNEREIKIGKKIVDITQNNYNEAQINKRFYESVLLKRENMLNFKEEKIDLFISLLINFIKFYDFNKKNSNKDMVYLNVFYFSVKNFFKNQLKEVDPNSFKDVVENYTSMFSFVEKMQENETQELGVFNSPKKYGLDDESIENLYNNQNIPWDKKSEIIMENIKKG